VRAKIVDSPERYKWSSTLGHMNRIADPILNNDSHIGIEGKDWLVFLNSENDNEIMEDIRKHSLTGRPCGDDSFIFGIEAVLGRNRLKAVMKCGRPKK
jgi:hypothetical protein